MQYKCLFQAALPEAVDARHFGRQVWRADGRPGRLLQLMDNNISRILPSILPQSTGVYWLPCCESSKRDCSEAWTFFHVHWEFGLLSSRARRYYVIMGERPFPLADLPPGLIGAASILSAVRMVQHSLHAQLADVRCSTSGSS